ncbi:hypothetical protein ACV344_34520, partial [Pseudomonas aeruginosa]
RRSRQSTGDFAELVRQQRQEQAQATVFVEPSLQFQATPPAVTAQRLRLQALDAVRLGGGLLQAHANFG